MDKFEALFRHYSFPYQEDMVSATANEIVLKHFDANNTLDVWKTCVGLIDLTTLNVDDTPQRVQTLVEAVNNFEKKYPIGRNVASICVYPSFIELVKKHLRSNSVGITSVAAGFPSSQTFIEVKIAEVALAVQSGATEIDVVLSVGTFLAGDYAEVYDELTEIKSMCGDARLKVILETGALQSYENIYKAAILAMQAGADFIKTSTGKIAVNATIEATLVMCRAIKEWHANTNEKVGFKAAGGISTTKEAVQHYVIVKEILGDEWLNKQSFRFGASRLANNLLSDIEGKEIKYF